VAALRWFEVSHHYLRERAFGPGLAYFLRGVFTWPFVRPGMYVLALDAALGTSLQRSLWRLRRAAGGA
jgi:hypothetical protein